MKCPPLAALLIVLSCLGCAQHEQRHDAGTLATAATPSMVLKDQVVEVGCAMCMFGVEGLTECETAIRVNGTIFYATGTGIPDAEDHDTGVCKVIRKARVSGTTSGDTFVASSFAVLP